MKIDDGGGRAHSKQFIISLGYPGSSCPSDSRQEI